MSDNRCIPYAERPADPTSLACYTFGEGEVAAFGRYLNHGYGGAAYDPTTRVGTPLIGQHGGIYVPDQPTSYWQGVAVPGVGLTADLCFDVAPAGTRQVVFNGTVAGTFHIIEIQAPGNIRATLDASLVNSTMPYSCIGRGPFRVDLWHDGVNQRLLVNGRITDFDAAPLVVPANNLRIGQHGEVLLAKIPSVSPGSDAALRASYVREFAKRVLYQWKPSAVGERSFATGNVGEGDFYCPVGGGGLSTVWRPNLSEPGGGHLALTGDGAPSMARLDFMHPRMPIFGSWLIEYEVRNPAWAGDSLIVGFTQMRGVDPTLAGSQSYWLNMYNNGGGWFRTSLYYENGAQIDGADILAASVAANDYNKCLLTHHVDGSWQVYTYNSSVRSWGWTVLNPVDVSNLNSNYLTIIPRGVYVTGVTRYQGEMTPHELESVV